MAQNTIGSMAAVVRATAGQFDSDLKQAGRSVQQFKSTVDSSSPAPDSFFGSMFGGGASFAAGFAAVQAGIAAVTGTVQKFFSTIDQTENMQDFARQIGATTEEITGLRFAAEVGGSSAEVMDAALQKMTQKLGEAREGSAETKVAFQALGLDIEKLSKMTAGEQLKTIADAFKQVKNPADQAAIAVDIFGKQGVNLVNVLNEGRDGIDGMIDRGRELGVVLGTDAATEMSNASTSIKEMKAAWEGLWNQLTLLVLPVLKQVVEWMTTIVSIASKVANGVKGLFEDPRARNRKPITESLPIIESGENPIEKLKAEAKAAEDLKKQAAKEADEAKKALDDLFRKGESVAKSMRTEQEKYNDTIADLNRLLDVGAIGMDTFKRGVMKAAAELQNATEQKREFDRIGATAGVSAAQAGTSAAVSAINASNRMQVDLQRKNNQLQEQMLAESKRQTEIQKLMADAMRSTSQTRIERAVDI